MFKTVASSLLLTSAFILSTRAFSAIPCAAEDFDKLPKTLISGTSLNGQSVKIKVSVPEKQFISRCAVSALEYGDMISYSFADGHEALVELTLENPLSFFRPTKKTLKLKHLSLDPTILADERAVYPNHVRISDRQAQVVYDIYLNRDGQAAMTRAYFKGY